MIDRFVESLRGSRARPDLPPPLETERGTDLPSAGLAALGITLTLVMSACGGGGSSTAPTAPSTPPPPTTAVVAQGTGSIGRFEVIKAVTFNTSASGRIDITVDWTFTTSLLQVSAYRGGCTAAELLALNCGTAIAFGNPPKPIRLSLSGAAAGAYTIGIINGSLADESFAYQVTLTR